MIGSTEVQLPSSTIRRLYEFGFNDGGSVAATFQLRAPYPYEPGRPILVGLCTDSQVSALLAGYGGSRHWICGHAPPSTGQWTTDAPCWQWTSLYTYDDAGTFSGPANWSTPSGLVPPTGSLSFVAISCHHNPDSVSTLDLSYACVNAGGEQLSSGEIPIKPITLAFTYIWASLAAVLLVHALYVRSSSSWASAGRSRGAQGGQQAPVRSLHVALWCCVLLSGASSFASWQAWISLSLLGTYSLPLDLGVTVLSDAASAAVVMLVLALSRGWHITRPGLMKHEVSAVMCLTLLYAASWAVWQWIGGFFSLFLLTLTYLLVLRYLFYSLTHSLRVLAVFRAYAATLLHEVSLREGTVLTRSGSSSSRRARPGLGTVGGGRPASPLGQEGQGGAPGKGGAQTEKEQDGEKGVEKGVYSITKAAPPSLHPDALSVDERTAAMLSLPAWGGLYDGGYSKQAGPPPPLAAVQGYGSTSVGEYEEREDVSLLGSQSGATGHGSSGSGSGGAWWRRAGARIMGALDYVTGIAPQQQEESERGWESHDGRESSGEASPILRDGGLTTRQLGLVRLLRSACVLYLSMDVFLNIWSELDLAVDPWVGIFMQNLCTFALLALLGAVLRPRCRPGTSPLYDPRGYVSGTEEVLEPLIGASMLRRARGVAGGGVPVAPRTGSGSRVSSGAKSPSNSGTAGEGEKGAPTFVVLMGPDGQLAGAGADTDAVDLSLPRVPVPRPAGTGLGPLGPISPSSSRALSLPPTAGLGLAGDLDADGWQDMHLALRLSMADMGQGMPMGRFR